MEKMKTGLLPALVLAAALAILAVLSAPAARAAGIAAVRVNSATLDSGDRIVIVPNGSRRTISQKSSGTRLAEADVIPANTEHYQVLTALSPDVAVFEVLSAPDGDFYLRGAQGYLTGKESGGGLFYAVEPQETSTWRFKDDQFLYNPHTVNNNFRNYYLEYFNGLFTTYAKTRSSGSDSFTFSIYLLTDSLPEEPVLEDAYYYLPVFATADIHGYLADTSTGETGYLLAYISQHVKQARSERLERAVFLDGGDIYQGTPMSNLLYGNSLSAAMARMGYDAAAIGNHEFDWGIENTVDADGTMMDYDLGSISGVNSVPVVCSNLYRNGQKVPFARDYLILEKTAADLDGNEIPVKVAVIGTAGDFGSSILAAQFSDAGYEIRVNYDEINALAASLEASGACDCTIVLAHEDASIIANGLGKNTAADLVIGGHTHVKMNGITSFGLRYMEPACNGKAYAEARLAFSESGGDARFQSVEEATVFSVSPVLNDEASVGMLDPAVVEVTDEALKLVSGLMKMEIGYITESAYRYEFLEGSGDRSSTLGQWMASMIARSAGADVGFVNKGALRLDVRLEEGADRRVITRSDLYSIFPFDNNIYCYEITYGELLQALEYGMTSHGQSLLSQMTGLDCYYTDRTVDALVSPDGTAIYAAGEWTPGWKDRTLTVAMPEFIATTDRVSSGLSNPFVAWRDTERLIYTNGPDSALAIDVLTREAAASGGALFIDTKPHFINRHYEGTGPAPTETPVPAPLEVPRTGDAAEPWLWAAALLLGVLGLGFGLRRLSRRGKAS